MGGISESMAWGRMGNLLPRFLLMKSQFPGNAEKPLCFSVFPFLLLQTDGK